MTAPNVRIHPASEVGPTIDVLTVADFDVFAVAQKIGVGNVRAGRVGTSTAPIMHARFEGPHVVGDDLDIDLTVVIADGSDLRFSYKGGMQADVARGFIQKATRIRITA